MASNQLHHIFGSVTNIYIYNNIFYLLYLSILIYNNILYIWYPVCIKFKKCWEKRDQIPAQLQPNTSWNKTQRMFSNGLLINVSKRIRFTKKVCRRVFRWLIRNDHIGKRFLKSGFRPFRFRSTVLLHVYIIINDCKRGRSCHYLKILAIFYDHNHFSRTERFPQRSS